MASLTNGHEFEQAPGDGKEQGSLVYCSPWGGKVLDRTELLHLHVIFGSFHAIVPLYLNRDYMT